MSLPENALRTFAPQIGRRKRPLQHGLYARPRKVQKVQNKRVDDLVLKATAVMPWIRAEHFPTLRKWAELELIRLAVFNAITQLSPNAPGTVSSMVRVDARTRDAGLIRLVDDYRKLGMSQLILERELLMTPATRAQLDSGDKPFDLVAAMAQASSDPPPAEEPPDEQPALEDPPPDKESPTEPGQPAPMKSAR